MLTKKRRFHLLAFAGLLAILTASIFLKPASVKALNFSPWEQIGLGAGGRFQSIGFSPILNGNGFYTVYLGGDTSGLFKSEDNGSSWTPINNGLYDFRISKIAVNPTNPNTIFVTTSGGLYKTVNAGESWTAINYGRELKTNQRNNALSSIAIDPSSPNTIYIGTGYYRFAELLPDGSTQIYKSTTGGNTGSWQPIYNSSGYLVYDITINPNRPNSLYAALAYRTNGGKLLHSADGGSSWSEVDRNHAYYELAFDNSNHLYATGWDPSREPSGQCYSEGGKSNASAMRVVRIDDSGSSPGAMEIITPSTGPQSTCKLAISPNGELYIADYHSWSVATVWKCASARTCNSSSWTAMEAIGQGGWKTPSSLKVPIYSLKVSPDNTPWSTTSMMVFKWDSNQWNERYSKRIAEGRYLTRGNDNTVLFARDMIFVNATEYYWGPGDIYVVGTNNGGSSFFQVKFPDPDETMNDPRVLRADGQNSQIWYVVTHQQGTKESQGKLFRKNASGDWQTILTSCRQGQSCPFSSPNLNNAGGMVDVLADGSTILVSTYYGGIYRSTNSGNSWNQVKSFADNGRVHKFSQSTLNPDYLMAAVGGDTGKGVWFSTNKGTNWTQVLSSSKSAYAVEYAGSSSWYASQIEEIYKTANNGQTWERVYTWQKRPDIFANRFPNSQDIDVSLKNPNNPNENPVCAAFDEDGWFDHPSMGGLACSFDGGTSWEQLELSGVTYHDRGVEFNPYNPNELFYLTYGSGVYKAILGSTPTPTPSPSPSPTPTPNPYDLNNDDEVNAADVLILLQNWRNGSQGDFNSDGKINSLDFGLLIANWGI